MKKPPPTSREKLPSLPRLVRDEICRRLWEGEHGGVIIAWLRDEIKVPFEVTAQNLSRFKMGSFYKQWLTDVKAHERRAMELRSVSRAAETILREASGDVASATAAIISGKLIALVDAFDEFDASDPDSIMRAHEFLKMVDTQRARDIDAASLKVKQETIALNKERAALARDRLSLDVDKWQRAASEALLDKAMSPEVQKIVGGDAPHEAKIAALKNLLFGNLV